MSIPFLNLEQHEEVLKRLVKLAEKFPETAIHPAGFEYSSLMTCFLLNNIGCAKSLLSLSHSFGKEWFPVSTGYSMDRQLFETEVTAHYLARNPAERSRKYIEFVNVLRKREMDACAKHRQSHHASWREAMELTWIHHWSEKESEINKRFQEVLPKFEQQPNRKGRSKIFEKWSGLSLRQMAIEVDHEEAYDVFYSYLSSFSHVDIRLADKFLKLGSNGPVWTMRSEEYDVANVFRYAAIFLTCFLQLIGHEFRIWAEEEVEMKWDFDEA